MTNAATWEILARRTAAPLPHSLSFLGHARNASQRHRNWSDETVLDTEFSDDNGFYNLFSMVQYFTLPRSDKELSSVLSAMNGRFPLSCGWIWPMIEQFRHMTGKSVVLILLQCPLRESYVNIAGDSYTDKFIAGIVHCLQRNHVDCILMNFRKQCRRDFADSRCPGVSSMRERHILAVATILELLIARNVFQINVIDTIAFSQCAIAGADEISAMYPSILGNVYRVPWHPRHLADVSHMGRAGGKLAIRMFITNVVSAIEAFTAPGTANEHYDRLWHWYQGCGNTTLSRLFSGDRPPLDGCIPVSTRTSLNRAASGTGSTHIIDRKSVLSRLPMLQTNPLFPFNSEEIWNLLLDFVDPGTCNTDGHGTPSYTKLDAWIYQLVRNTDLLDHLRVELPSFQNDAADSRRASDADAGGQTDWLDSSWNAYGDASNTALSCESDMLVPVYCTSTSTEPRDQAVGGHSIEESISVSPNECTDVCPDENADTASIMHEQRHSPPLIYTSNQTLPTLRGQAETSNKESEQLLRRREARRLYKQSPKGIAARRRYKKGPSGRAAEAKYKNSEKGRKCREREKERAKQRREQEKVMSACRMSGAK